MQWRYHELRGKHVRSRDGHDLGPVIDLVAERQGDALRVTALLVGRAAVLRRIAFKDVPVGPFVSHRLPWSAVERIDDEIHLSIDMDQVKSGDRPQEGAIREQKGRERAG